jgi:hypothetical protein
MENSKIKAIIEFMKVMNEKGLVNGIDEYLHNIGYNVVEKFTGSLNEVMQEMMKYIVQMPYLKDIATITPLYDMVKVISLSGVSLVVGYKGLKMLLSEDEMDRMEGKRTFSRLVYSLIFSMLSLKYIDGMIFLNNTASSAITSKHSITPFSTGKETGLLLPLLFFVGEGVILLKVSVGFWMRMAELVFAGIISPIMFTLSINKEWSGYLKNWSKRTATLVFSQTTTVLILILFSMMMEGLMLSGTFAGGCLSVATLLMMDRGPEVLQRFGENVGYSEAKTSVTKLLNSKVIKAVKKFGSSKE